MLQRSRSSSSSARPSVAWSRARRRTAACALVLASCSRASSEAGDASAPRGASTVAAGAADAAAVLPEDFVGTLGNRRVAMHLVLDHQSARGAYQYEPAGEPLALEGSVDTGGAIALAETSEGEKTGSLLLRATDGGLSGEWTDPHRTKTLPVVLAAGAPTRRLAEPIVEVRRCGAPDLTIALGHLPASAGQASVPIVLTNHGADPCSVRGRLESAFTAAPGKAFNTGSTYPIPPGSGRPEKRIVLAPGKSAHATLTYLADDGIPTSGLAVTLPGERVRAAMLPWPPGRVFDHSTATHPGTFLEALEAGAGDSTPAHARPGPPAHDTCHTGTGRSVPCPTDDGLCAMDDYVWVTPGGGHCDYEPSADQRIYRTQSKAGATPAAAPSTNLGRCAPGEAGGVGYVCDHGVKVASPR